ncbi:Shq1p [Sugiyamaella lignohabitans]|uniref:Shq1p n=1 Tax=Sugiyamaella lignohabitans TaxID=796027 RepID=A0A167EXC2_9ASCO|nr:Shq1p [Sugiyamaella lignohabitans]ANB14568.1 Shq1p [Sugiyamaella lignohabitans]
MITPQFSVDQDDEFIYIKIKAPYIKAQNIEFVVDENVFIFSLHPYYLRLRFPGKIIDDDDRSSANYDLKTSMVSVKLPKEVKGEHFEDLDMITKLLARKNEETTRAAKPTIEEIDTEGGKSGNGDLSVGDSSNEIASATQELDEKNANTKLSSLGEEFDWEIEQTIPAPLTDSEDQKAVMANKYGFDNGYSGLMSMSVMNGNDINDLSDPDKLSPSERAKERTELEIEKFDPDYYLSDLFDNPMIEEIISWTETSDDSLTSQESDRLARLSKKTYLLDSEKQTYIGLVSLLFGSCYDKRINMGDSTVESAWTIGKLSPLISCLDNSFASVQDIMIGCTRRSLCYPLYRSWALSLAVWNDVYHVLKRGKRAVLKELAKLVLMFDIDLYNVYNQILLEDYAVWIQYSSENVIRSLAHEVHKTTISKESMGFDLLEYEEAAKEALADQDMDQVD